MRVVLFSPCIAYNPTIFLPSQSPAVGGMKSARQISSETATATPTAKSAFVFVYSFIAKLFRARRAAYGFSFSSSFIFRLTAMMIMMIAMIGLFGLVGGKSWGFFGDARACPKRVGWNLCKNFWISGRAVGKFNRVEVVSKDIASQNEQGTVN